MRKIICLFIIITVFITSCKKDALPYRSEFEASLQKWKDYKASVNDHYTYTVITSSFTGVSTSTLIAVENGVITLRWYTVYTNNNGTVTIAKTWIENQASLNTHQEGAAAITIDDIYTKAKSEWLTVDRTKNNIYFETDDRGIIKSCGFVPNGCQDDCFTGVSIRSIEHL